MRTHQLIMLPGEWEGEAQSFKLGELAAPITGEIAHDIAKRVRTTGFLAHRLDASQGERLLAGVREAGHDGALLTELRIPWTYPELRFGNRVAISADRIEYTAGISSGDVRRESVTFMHAVCVVGTRRATSRQPGARPTTSLKPSELLTPDKRIADPLRAEGLCVDVHLKDPRIVLRLDLRTTRYTFPEDGVSTPIIAKPAQLLEALARFAIGVLIVPDTRLLGLPLSDDPWKRAEVVDDAAHRLQSSWFRQLVENRQHIQLTKALKARESTGIERGEDLRAAYAEMSMGSVVTNELQDQLDAAERWLKRGLAKRALKEAERAIAMRPDRPEGYHMRARVHLALGDAPAAEQDMADADRLDPQR